MSENFFRFCALASTLLALPFFSVLAAGPEELKKLIDEKNGELKEVSDKIQEVQKNLEELEGKGRSLNSEIKKINYNISQVNLSIKSSGLRIQKISFEIESLGYDIKDVEEGIVGKKEAIAQILRELQRKDGETLLETILKNKSLGESFLEAQSLADLNTGLAVEVGELKNFNVELKNKLDIDSVKKTNLEEENQNFKNQQNILKDQKLEKDALLTNTKNQEKQYQKLLDELEEKQAKIGAEIAEAESELRVLFDPAVLPGKRSGVLAYPISSVKVTQDYGATAFAQRAYKTKFHNGVDFGAPIGTPVLAAADGTVTAVDNNDRGASRWQRFQYGRYVIVKHDNNLATLYAHLSRSVVNKDFSVKKGEIIGYVGNTGYSFGPHLHFTVYWAPSVQFKLIPPAAGLVPIGVTINPLDYL